VSWALDQAKFNPYDISTSHACEAESKEYPHSCYCGHWSDGQCWALLPKEEQAKIEEQRTIERAKTSADEFPF
jgi:hypothetical protein